MLGQNLPLKRFASFSLRFCSRMPLLRLELGAFSEPEVTEREENKWEWLIYKPGASSCAHKSVDVAKMQNAFNLDISNNISFMTNK